MNEEKFYAKFVAGQTTEPTVYMNGTPKNFTVRWFDTHEAMQQAISEAWESGGNGFECDWKTVLGYFRPAPHLLEDGTVKFVSLTIEEIEAGEAAAAGY